MDFEWDIHGMKSFDQFVCLAGLPRTGSTLLSTLLQQNPAIHAEGNSAVCQLMWDIHQSCAGNSREQLMANKKEGMATALGWSVPHIYYRGINKPIVVDKCRTWPLASNMEMLRRCITDKPRVIVLMRPLIEVVSSFVKLYRANGEPQYSGEQLLDVKTGPIVWSYFAARRAMEHNNGEFLFVECDDLIENTASVLKSIYDFCGWEPFEHSLTGIVNQHPEDDSVYGLEGMHRVCPSITPKAETLVLSDAVVNRCRELETMPTEYIMRSV